MKYIYILFLFFTRIFRLIMVYNLRIVRTSLRLGLKFSTFIEHIAYTL